MNINEKIDEIRKKPEHIRMRYVWGSVFLSMLFIICIWIFSIVVMFKGDDDSIEITNDGNKEVLEKIEEIKKGASLLKEGTENISKSLSNDNIENKANTETKYGNEIYKSTTIEK